MPELKLPAVEGVRARRRVVRARLPFSAYEEIVISFRRFKTAKHRRSQKFSQSVFRTPAFSFKETAVALKRRRRSQYQNFPKPNPQQLTVRTSLAMLLVVVGAAGVFYFATHLKMQPKLYVSNKPGPSTRAATGTNVAQTLGASLKQSKINLIEPVASVNKPKPPPLPAVMARSDPARIVIPRIGIDTSLLPVDLNPANAIAMPNVFDQAGWYDKSPTPGERGPAVIVGHVDSTQGIAIFWRLRELQPGDIVQVQRQDNTVASFQVTDIEQFQQDNFPSQSVYGNLSYAGIRLITCGGTFNTATGHYDMNTVVFGSLINA